MTDYTGLDGGPRRERLRAAVVGLVVAAAGFGAGFVALIALLGLFSAVGVDARSNLVLLYGLSVLALQGIGLLVVGTAFVALRGRWDLLRARLPSLRELGVTVAGVIGLLVLLGTISAAYSALGVSTPEVPLVDDSLQNPELALYMIPLTFVLVGPGEELMFRGIVQGLLREAYAPLPAISIASIVFAAVHLTNVLGAPLAQQGAYLAVIFVLSLLLGAVYEYTDNLVVPALIHSSYNSLLFLALYGRAIGLG